MRAAWISFIAGCGFQAQIATPDGAGAAAAAPDSAFDVAACPASYSTVLSGVSGPSRYRVITSGGKAADQSDACNRDLEGATHLIVLDSMPELVAVAALVDSAPDNAIAHNAVWVGGVQPRTAAQPRDQWLGFDDLPLIDQWAGGEPNDGAGGPGESDHSEQFVMVEHNKHYLTDAANSTTSGALCECDGRPVGAIATTTIASNR